MLECTSQPDIPKPILKYVNNIEPMHRRKLYYAADWNNYNLYVLRIIANKPREIVSAPILILYDGKKTRITNKEERQKLYHYAFPKYIPTSCEQIYYLNKMD